jgi:HAD superfamily hydrolase (TIGR01484 family)
MEFSKKKLTIFDLDGTLAKSKCPMEPVMAELIMKLLALKKVAVISGGGYPQFQTQFLVTLPSVITNYSGLYLLPTSGTRLYVWKGAWIEEYAEDLTPHEKERILMSLEWSLRVAKFEKPAKTYGPLIEDRGSQITFSAIGQSAPIDVKSIWDPDRKKREAIAAVLQKKLPQFDVRLGGATSIDVTKRGVNKAYGIRKLEQYLHVEADDIVFVGDALFYGGNDYPAKATGVDCIQVSGPEETEKIIRGWLA